MEQYRQLYQQILQFILITQSPSLMRSTLTSQNKQNRPTLQRRLSLKFSSAVNPKNNPRMSIPTRRESLVTMSAASNHHDIQIRQFRQSRPSLASCVSTSISKIPPKDMILTNLMKKLDHEEELKSIIQSKIKNTRDYDYSYYRDGYQNNDNVEIKLKNCQEELQSFKEIVKGLMQKISALEQGKSRNLDVKRQDVSTQTENKHNSSVDNSGDFMDNLDKTLKILSGKKSK